MQVKEQPLSPSFAILDVILVITPLGMLNRQDGIVQEACRSFSFTNSLVVRGQESI
jgi:hypothetical protein